MLSIYLSGTDSYAHVAQEGPDEARHAYLRDVVDPLIARLAEGLAKRHALDDRWVVVTSDHGHSEVLHDDAHALSMEGDHEPPALLAKAGFRVRPFKLDLAPDADFQAVLAYQGAWLMAWRSSTCADPGRACIGRARRGGARTCAGRRRLHRNSHDGSLIRLPARPVRHAVRRFGPSRCPPVDGGPDGLPVVATALASVLRRARVAAA
jgi:hypothetical protein